MDSFKLRPRFKLETNASVNEILDLFLKRLQKPDENVIGSTLMHHVYLKIKQEKQHYWSPELHITVEELSGGSLIRGVAGPKPRIWTMFMFFYSAVIVLFLFGSALGISQWSLGIKAPWLWSIPASVVAWGVIVAAAKYGQYKGKSQLRLLYKYMKEALDGIEKKNL